MARTSCFPPTPPRPATGRRHWHSCGSERFRPGFPRAQRKDPSRPRRIVPSSDSAWTSPSRCPCPAVAVIGHHAGPGHANTRFASASRRRLWPLLGLEAVRGLREDGMHAPVAVSVCVERSSSMVLGFDERIALPKPCSGLSRRHVLSSCVATIRSAEIVRRTRPEVRAELAAEMSLLATRPSARNSCSPWRSRPDCAVVLVRASARTTAPASATVSLRMVEVGAIRGCRSICLVQVHVAGLIDRRPFAIRHRNGLPCPAMR